jgi:hypothetical protein
MHDHYNSTHLLKRLHVMHLTQLSGIFSFTICLLSLEELTLDNGNYSLRSYAGAEQSFRS